MSKERRQHRQNENRRREMERQTVAVLLTEPREPPSPGPQPPLPQPGLSLSLSARNDAAMARYGSALEPWRKWVMAREFIRLAELAGSPGLESVEVFGTNILAWPLPLFLESTHGTHVEVFLGDWDIYHYRSHFLATSGRWFIHEKGPRSYEERYQGGYYTVYEFPPTQPCADDIEMALGRLTYDLNLPPLEVPSYPGSTKDQTPQSSYGSPGLPSADIHNHPTPHSGNPIALIGEIGALRDAGIISDEEFETKKAELLKRI